VKGLTNDELRVLKNLRPIGAPCTCAGSPRWISRDDVPTVKRLIGRKLLVSVTVPGCAAAGHVRRTAEGDTAIMCESASRGGFVF
jgi:hypothetical protein